ncbi:MAG: hypothetical protein WKF36_07550, partial [Candidatus Nitrosocosmicus sp.]
MVIMNFPVFDFFNISKTILKESNKSVYVTSLILFFLFFCSLLVFHSPIQYAQGHFDHLSHYNGGGFGISDKYYVNQQLEPTYTKPNELSKVMFSVQDNAGRDVQNIVAMVEIYSLHGERVSVFPWSHLDIGDFGVPFVFPKAGSYHIVLSVLNSGVDSSQIINTVPPARSILGDNSNCNCERGVFNVSITQNFGTIFVMVIYISIFLAVSVLGAALIWIFWSRRNNKAFDPLSNNDFVKYSVLFLAFGASVVHLAVAPGHAGLRLEYSLFL